MLLKRNNMDKGKNPYGNLLLSSRFKILYFLKHHSKYSGTKNLFSIIT